MNNVDVDTSNKHKEYTNSIRTDTDTNNIKIITRKVPLLKQQQTTCNYLKDAEKLSY